MTVDTNVVSSKLFNSFIVVAVTRIAGLQSSDSDNNKNRLNKRRHTPKIDKAFIQATKIGLKIIWQRTDLKGVIIWLKERATKDHMILSVNKVVQFYIALLPSRKNKGKYHYRYANSNLWCNKCTKCDH